MAGDPTEAREPVLINLATHVRQEVEAHAARLIEHHAGCEGCQHPPAMLTLDGIYENLIGHALGCTRPPGLKQIPNEVWIAVEGERRRQDAKWGGADHDDSHDAGDWVGIIMGLFLDREPFKASDATPADCARLAVQIAAVAVAWLEALQRADGG